MCLVGHKTLLSQSDCIIFCIPLHTFLHSVCQCCWFGGGKDVWTYKQCTQRFCVEDLAEPWETPGKKAVKQKQKVYVLVR